MPQPMPEPAPDVMCTVTQAAGYTGVSRSSVQRYADNFYADVLGEPTRVLKAGWSGGARVIDSWDAERLRRIRKGKLPKYVTPEMWAQAWPAAAAT